MSEMEATRPVRVPATRVQAGPAPVVLTGGTGQGAGGARIVPFVEDGIVRYLEVHCGCGKVTVVKCLYDEEGGNG